MCIQTWIERERERGIMFEILIKLFCKPEQQTTYIYIYIYIHILMYVKRPI